MILRGTINDWYALPFVLAAGIVAVLRLYWRFIMQRLHGIRASNWPPVSAIIDVVSVAKQEDRSGKGTIVTYLATLTYFYRNPELQTGDYCRLFDEEADAQDWAAPYKGRPVTVHVDPRDPSRSFLRKEELE